MMFLTMMLLSDPSFAGSDAKRYPGLMCRPLDSSDDFRIYYGQLFNTMTASMDVECPVVRDLNTDIDDSYLYVFDNSSRDSVTCALYSHNGSTASIYWTGHFSTSVGNYSSYAKKLSIGALTTFSTDKVYFWCNLPATDKGWSGVGWYYADEV